jgi:hypothetical protein
MRTITEINHPNCRISVFSWNQKYLIKLEQPGLEQTFKVNEIDVTGGDEGIKKMITEEFIAAAVKRFDDMRAQLIKLIG